MIRPKTDVLNPDTQATGAKFSMRGRSPSENCTRIKDLGFTTSRHINMYGERFEIVSDPFNEGNCIAVHAISGNDPADVPNPADCSISRSGFHHRTVARGSELSKMGQIIDFRNQRV